MEQGTLRSPMRIVDCDPALILFEQARQRSGRQCLPGDQSRRCTLTPEMSQVRLAATRGAVQRKRRRRPIRPPVDPLDSRHIPLRGQEIRSGEGWTAAQVKRELDHQTRIMASALEGEGIRRSQRLLRARKDARPSYEI